MKKKIEELFRLAMKAQEKTSAYVSFDTSNHGWGCVVMIMDDGFEVKHGYDGWYEMDMFYSDERSYVIYAIKECNEQIERDTASIINSTAVSKIYMKRIIIFLNPFLMRRCRDVKVLLNVNTGLRTAAEWSII